MNLTKHLKEKIKSQLDEETFEELEKEMGKKSNGRIVLNLKIEDGLIKEPATIDKRGNLSWTDVYDTLEKVKLNIFINKMQVTYHEKEMD